MNWLRCVLLTPALATALVSVHGVAQGDAPACRTTQSVVVQGRGAPSGPATGDGYERALTNAFSAAIAQVAGVYVRHLTTLETIATTQIDDAGVGGTLEDRFEERLETSVSGFVSSYRVLARRNSATGTELEVRVDVCVDPRLALTILGETAAISSFEAVLQPLLEASGWTTVRDLIVSRNEDDAIARMLRSGAVASLEIDLTIRDGPDHRGLSVVTAAAGASFTDLRTQELRTSTSFVAEGAGPSRVDAVRAAVSDVARRTGATFVLREGVVEARVVDIVIHGVTRSYTRIELTDEVVRTIGSDDGVDASWDEASGTLRVRLATPIDACSIATALEAYRRILIQSLSCDAFGATLQVVRE